LFALASRLNRNESAAAKFIQQHFGSPMVSRIVSVPTRPQLTPKDLQLGIERLERRIVDVEALKPDELEKWSPVVEALQASVDDALARVFGHETVEYNRYRKTVDWAADMPSFGAETTLEKYRADVTKGRTGVLVMLRQAVQTLREELSETGADPIPMSISLKPSSKKIFIVHGHDEGALQTVARFLENSGLEPVILNEQANRNRTVIEKIEANSDVAFAIVLLTPDDEGGKKGEPVKPRARQNVLLELGYFIAKLGRGNVCALKRGDVDIPSDFAGVLWTNYDSAGAWKMELTKELKAAGFDMSKAKL
jgi:predicted nucleotide-binding protein